MQFFPIEKYDGTSDRLGVTNDSENSQLIIQFSDQCIKVLLFDLYMSQLFDLYHQLILLLFTECLIYQYVFDVVLLRAMQGYVFVLKLVLLSVLIIIIYFVFILIVSLL